MYSFQSPLSPPQVNKSTDINLFVSSFFNEDIHERKSGSMNVFSRSAGPPQLQQA